MAQKDYPVIGESMPEFSLTNVQYYTKKTFDKSALNGKWTIMDFWTQYCTSCVRSFPKVNQLQVEFKDQVQFLLVAKNNNRLHSNTDQIYERYRKKFDLQLPIAYDSIIFDQFGVEGVPHIVVIDPQGTVYAVTDSYFLTAENLRELVSGNKPSYKRKYSAHEETPASAYHEPWKYLVTENDKERDFLYRSLLASNKGEPQAGSWNIDQHIEQGYFQIARANLFQLYNIAYWGKSEWHRWMPMYAEHWALPVLEISDPSRFQFNYLEDEGLYNYSLVVPKGKTTISNLMELMQRDLKYYFGYEVSMETRMMPYWRLTATDEARRNLPTKSKSIEQKLEPTGIKAKKIPVGLVLSHIEKYNYDDQIPYIDETGMKGPIDISYEAVMTDLEEVRKALKQHGLILEKSMKKMKVLVIRDSKPIK